MGNVQALDIVEELQGFPIDKSPTSCGTMLRLKLVDGRCQVQNPVTLVT